MSPHQKASHGKSQSPHASRATKWGFILFHYVRHAVSAVTLERLSQRPSDKVAQSGRCQFALMDGWLLFQVVKDRSCPIAEVFSGLNAVFKAEEMLTEEIASRLAEEVASHAIVWDSI